MTLTKISENNSSGSLSQTRKEIAKVMSAALSVCGIKRDDVAKKMSDTLGRKITKHMLDAYASEARDQHIPALDVAIAFDMAIGQTALSGYFVSQFGGKIALGKDIQFLELARIQSEKSLLRQREKKAMLAAGLVDRDVLETVTRLEMLEADVMAYQLIFAWLMANQQGDESLDFLRAQALELERNKGVDNKKYELELAASALDRVRGLAIEWRETNGIM